MAYNARRQFLKAAASAVAAPLLATSAHSAAGYAYSFVRIKGLAEQAVGETILLELYKRIGMNVSIEALPGRRALQLASSGDKDGETLRVYGLGEKVSSLRRMPVPLSSLQTVAFRKKGSGVDLSAKEDLHNHSSAIIQGVLHTVAITEGVEKVFEVNNAESIFKMLQAGRCDLALTSAFDGEAWLKRLGITDLEQVPFVLNDQPLFHYVHESKSEILDKLTPVAEAMEVSGELGDIRKKAEEAYLSSV